MRVVVVGGGVIGTATARELARRGAAVTLLERGGLAAGTSSRGEGNMLVSDKEIPAEAALAVRSLALWRAFAEESREPFEYEPKGGIVAAWTDTQVRLLAELAQRQRAWGIDSSVLDGPSLRAIEPGLADAVVGGLHYPQDAQVMPIHAVRALGRACRDLGVAVRTGVAVTGVAPARAGVRVATSAGPVEADAVVLCAGPWAGSLAASLGGSAPVFPRRGSLLVTQPLPPGTVRHKVYDGRYVEAVASDEAATQVAPVVESTAAGTILIGSSREAVGWDDDVPWPVVGRLAALAVELFPALATAQVIRTYQGFRPATPDHLPLIGPDAHVAGLFHHTGHEGAGIGLALGSAELLADAVLDGRVDPAFDPRRFAGAAGVEAEEGPAGAASAGVDAGVPGLPGRGSRGTRAPSPDQRGVPGSPGSGDRGTRAPSAGPAAPSIAVAHLREGEQAWRTTRLGGHPRGLFCGIGHCHDCLTTLPDGRVARACLTPAAALPVPAEAGP